MRIKEQLISSRSRAWSGRNKATSITVHETANRNRGANAQAHSNLQSNGNVRQASWHIQVDDKQAIRSFPDTVRCWHAGRAAQDSLSIEICVNSDGDYDKALANAAEVIKKWRKKHGLGRNDVVDHHHWSGKNCPTILRGSGKWAEFVASTDPDGSTPAPSTIGGSSSSGSSGKSVATLAQEVIDGKHGTGDARKSALGSQYNAVQREVNRILGAGSSSGGGKSIGTLAQEVIDGKHGTGEARKRSLGSQYSAVQAEVNRRLNGGGSSGGGGSSVSRLAREVIDGKHGTGNARRRALGSQYAAVQAEVNRILGGGGSSGGGKSTATLAQEVIDGKWGNEPDRSRRLRADGHNPKAVQRAVNRRLA